MYGQLFVFPKSTQLQNVITNYANLLTYIWILLCSQFDFWNSTTTPMRYSRLQNKLKHSLEFVLLKKIASKLMCFKGS